MKARAAVVIESRHSTLDEFLAVNRTAILARARAKVAARPAPRATEEELESGIPLFLDQLIDSLRVFASDDPRRWRRARVCTAATC